MSRPRDRGDAPLLFDLPMNEEGTRPKSQLEDAATEPEASTKEPASGVDTREDAAESLPLFPPADASSQEDDSTVSEDATQNAGPARATLAKRFLATAIDLLVWLAALLLLALGASLLGVTPSPRDWPAALLFVAAFSFLYTVIPLAFWGKTPGMAWARIVAHSGDGEALTFGQTGTRWIATMVTIGLLGLPGLLALLPGGSLADRWSRSHTEQE